MNGILKQMKKIKHALAVMLCMALLLEGTGMQVLAETTSDVLNDVAAVSDVENASSGGTTDGGTIDGEEDEPESDAPVMASGNYCEGVTWTLYEDGLLVVKGTAAEGVRSYTRGWCNDGYPQYIKNAKVRVKGVASLYNFFYDCYNLETADFNGSDMSKLVDMSYLFYGCNNLKYVDFNGLDTSDVTNMSAMFFDCHNLKNVDLSGFNTEMVNNVSNMFIDCYNLNTLDLSSFDLANVTNGSAMLTGTKIQILKAPRNLTVDISIGYTMYDSNGTVYNKLPVDVETSSILTSRIYFDDYEDVEIVEKSGVCCEGITWTLTNKGKLTIEGIVVDNEDTSSTSLLSNGWSSYKDYIVSANVNVVGVKSFAYLFKGCKNLESVDFTGSDTNSLTDIKGMFYECSNLQNLDMSDITTKKCYRYEIFVLWLQ